MLLLFSMSIASLQRQSVIIYNKTSLDKYGRETVGSGTVYNARVNLKDRNKMAANNEIKTINGNVILPPNATVNINDRLDYNGVKYKIFSKNVAVGGGGQVHHITVEIIRWQET